MKNINIITLKKFQNTANYQLIEDGVYNDLNDIAGFSTYRIAIAVTIEQEKLSVKEVGKQLEKHFVYIEESLGADTNNVYKYVLGGELEDIKQFLVLQNRLITIDSANS